jgi:hypothetical protein
VVKLLPCKHEALSSKSSTSILEREREREREMTVRNTNVQGASGGEVSDGNKEHVWKL